MLREKFKKRAKKRQRMMNGKVQTRSVKKRRMVEPKQPSTPVTEPEPRLHRHFRPAKHKPPSATFTDTGVCDVNTYFQRRLDKLYTEKESETINSVLLKWLEFQPKIKEALQENAIDTQPLASQKPNGKITHFFHLQPTNEDIHKRLVRMCRSEVFGEKMYIPDPAKTYTCTTCNSSLPQHKERFELVCPICGTSVPDISSRDRNIKEFEGVQTTTHNSYKRRNHLNEWLLRVQACDRPIPNVVVERVQEMFDKWSLPRQSANYALVRRFLRHTGYQKYFDNIPQIIVRITRQQIKPIGPENLAKIRKIFVTIQRPFEKYKPKQRKNFISYSYVLYKVFELLNLDDYLSFFPLLKSRQNLNRADLLWKKVCEECGFQYISTS